MSRATSLQGLHILNELNSKHVKVDSRVHDEYSRLRRLKPNDLHEIVPTNHQNNSDITLCLLNIRSLTKHSCDTKCDVNLFQSDILAVTETKLLPRDNDSDIRNLTPFALYSYDHNSDKFSSLAICIRHNIHILHHEHFPTLNAINSQL